MTMIMTAQEVMAAALKAGYRSANHLCHVAGVQPSTFSRWRNGLDMPTLRSYEKLLSAIATPPTTDTPPSAAHDLGGDAETEDTQCPD